MPPRGHREREELRPGKIPIPTLKRTVLRFTGAGSREIAVRPRAGVDFAAITHGTGYLIVSSDPITGLVTDIGSYAVQVSANDVATSGNRPRFMDAVVLLPEGSDEATLADISRDMGETAERIGVTIVGGHTEVTPRLGRPIVVATVFCFAEKFVTSAGARPGDALLMTKTAGIEGTVALGSDDPAGNVGAGLRRKAAGLLGEMSVIEEAVSAFGTGAVHAMHDCTEGGVLGAAFEMSLASETGFELRSERVPVAPATAEMCALFGIDALKLIGSGSLLIAADPRRKAEVIQAVGKVSKVTEVGEFTARGRYLAAGKRKVAVEEAPEDELWRLMSRFKRAG
jgi:hydrogenase expression/formation protein HypE